MTSQVIPAVVPRREQEELTMLARLIARWRCHGTWWCCQYVDQPMCNSPADPHRFARVRFRRQARRMDQEV